MVSAGGSLGGGGLEQTQVLQPEAQKERDGSENNTGKRKKTETSERQSRDSNRDRISSFGIRKEEECNQ